MSSFANEHFQIALNGVVITMNIYSTDINKKLKQQQVENISKGNTENRKEISNGMEFTFCVRLPTWYSRHEPDFQAKL